MIYRCGPWVGSTMADFDRVRVLWPDHLGLARGKYVPARLAERGANHCAGVFGQGFHRGVSRVLGAGFEDGFPDLVATFDLADVRPAWEDATGVVVADIFQAGGAGDGEPVVFSPRHALRRAVADWNALGYQPQIGVELEAFVLEPDGAGGWRPWTTPGAFVYGTGAFVDPVGMIDELMRAGDRCGLGIESVNSESDVPQFEITLEHSDAVDAVDRAFLFRLMAREIAYRRGLLVTFMGRPFGDKAGSGLHVNVSLTAGDGSNAFADHGASDGLSALACSCVAGLIEHHVGMTALCAPTVNAYKRLLPGALSGYWANWGYDHRGTANRIPPHRGGGTRIENRLSDGAANPYLAVTAILQAARLGYIGGSTPPPPEVGDGLAPGTSGVHSPSNLAAALDALEADVALVEAIGRDLIANFVGIKRAEWERFSAAVTDWEINEYLWMT